jgi:hypothetical protein
VLFEPLLGEGSRSEEVISSLLRSWKSWAPSKVKTFTWQLILDRIPTIMNLFSRRFISVFHSTSCPFCVLSEMTDHILVLCPIPSLVWYKVCKCLGCELVLTGSVLCLFQLIESHGERARGRLSFILIWHAVVWTLWKARNGFMFAGKPVEVKPLAD